MFKIPNNDYISLLGNKSIKIVHIKIFDKTILNFISDISKNIFKDRNLRNYPDIVSFAFWTRKNNLLKLKNDYLNFGSKPIGRGLVFHIVPSNVPTNFVYSMIFGLLSGNSNIIKLPEKNFVQIEIIINLIKRILKKKNYKNIENSLMFIKYDKSKKFITQKISQNSDARLVWGGDSTVVSLKNVFTKKNSVDINFPDKYSFSVIDTDILNINFLKLVEKFYNDTFLYDQNACSSPHLILWSGKNKKRFKDIFWKNLADFVKNKYSYPTVAKIEKLEKIILDNIKFKNNIKTYVVNDILNIVKLKKPINNVDQCRGKWGYFYEFDLVKLKQIDMFCNDKFQTLTFFTKKNSKLNSYLKQSNLLGVNRIVPIGKALEIDLNWDGNDMVRILSKKIDKINL